MQAPAFPKFSVVVPVYNGAAFIDQCIRSVLAQSHRDFELVVGDDVSTDSSKERILAFKDTRLRYVENPVNYGLFGNLNRLLQSARGDLVHLLCQDDFLYPDCLESEKAFYDTHPKVDFAFTKTRRVDGAGRILGICRLNDLPAELHKELCLQHFYYFGCLPGNLSTVSARNSGLKAVGPFDEGYGVCADYDMWVRMAQRFNMGVIHRHLIGLRQHADQLSHAPASGLQSVRGNRAIRKRIALLLPCSIRAHARKYAVLRHNVLDVHYAMRCLLAGRFRDACSVLRDWGFLEFLLSALAWLFTANNRLYRPRPKFDNA